MEIIILLLLVWLFLGLQQSSFQDVNTRYVGELKTHESLNNLNSLDFGGESGGGCYESAGITNNQIRGVKSAEEQQTQNPDVFFHRERRMHDD